MRSDANLQKSTHRLSLRSLSSTAIAVALLVAAAGPALAQSNCGARDDLLRILQDSYAEVPVAKGVTENGQLVELLTNSTKWSWSIIVTTPDGKSCLVADGEAWENIPVNLFGGRSS